MDQTSTVAVTQVWDLLRDLGFAGCLIFILWGGYRRWWVWGYQLTELDTVWKERYNELKQREAEWKEVAIPAIHMVSKQPRP